MSQPDHNADKSQWRQWANETRAGIDWERISAAVVRELRAWPPLSTADTTLTYMPIANEVDLGGLRAAGLQTRFFTTRTPDHGGELTIHELGGPMEVHRFGFLQPHASAREVDPASISVFLLPGLAFDVYGNRLGRGAGYYDGLLSRIRPGAFTVGVTPADLVVDVLPTEAHDRKVRFLATEEGVIETAHGRM